MIKNAKQLLDSIRSNMEFQGDDYMTSPVAYVGESPSFTLIERNGEGQYVNRFLIRVEEIQSPVSLKDVKLLSQYDVLKLFLYFKQFIKFKNKEMNREWKGYIDMEMLETNGREWFTENCIIEENFIDSEGGINLMNNILTNRGIILDTYVELIDRGYLERLNNDNRKYQVRISIAGEEWLAK